MHACFRTSAAFRLWVLMQNLFLESAGFITLVYPAEPLLSEEEDRM